MGRHGQNAPVPKQSSTGALRLQGDASEMCSLDVRDAVVDRKTFVEERVVGGQQFERAAVLTDDAVEEQLRLALHRCAQRSVEVREAESDGNRTGEIAQIQPLPGKILHK